MVDARPLDALNRAKDKKVIVDLKNQRQYIGTLKAFDIHINVVLDDTEARQAAVCRADDPCPSVLPFALQQPVIEFRLILRAQGIEDGIALVYLVAHHASD